MATINAGQFSGPTPWGWLVRDGRESQPPGAGTLAMTFAVDRAGRVALLEPPELATLRAPPALAFQSYPALLVGEGDLPWELRAPGRGANLGHRDSRLALGLRRDGTLLVALTRFTGLGRTGEQLPWGPTVGEMAAWMRAGLPARGAPGRRALGADGGAGAGRHRSALAQPATGAARDGGARALAWTIHEPAACERGLLTIRCVVRPAASSTCPPTRLPRGRPNSLRLVHIPHSRLAVHE